MTARADLHVHSKHSNRPSEWILRQFGAPESFTEPREVYRICRERGMDFVTLSDHDTIEGALEIAHLPGTFLSCEVTAAFPEDGCELHCLVTGISEAEHRDIQELRGNLYELRDYLRERDILHSIAHPFYRVNDRLTLDHLEKLIVLFNRFEALNGIHDRRGNELVRRICGSLTREAVEGLAERHRLEPAGPTPWLKTFTGGSDDHGGLYIATTYTATPPAATVEEYLAHLRAGRHEPGGDTGSTLRLVQSLYSIAHEYYARQFPSRLAGRKDPFAELLRTLARVPAEPERPKSGLRGRLAGLSLAGLLRRGAPPRPASPAVPAPLSQPVDRATFAAASKASEKYVISLLRGFLRHARRGRLSESLSAFSQLAPLAVCVAPYLVALQAQHKDAHLMEAAALRFLGQLPEGDRAGKKAWFTDTPAHALGSPARESGGQIVVVTCGGSPPAGLAAADFKPILRFPVPGCESLQMTLPPLLEILDHCERERYCEIIVGTPGPLGLAGLAAGKLLGIPVTGIHHPDLPARVLHLAGSPALEEMTRKYLGWFCGQMKTLYPAAAPRVYPDLAA